MKKVSFIFFAIFFLICKPVFSMKNTEEGVLLEKSNYKTKKLKHNDDFYKQKEINDLPNGVICIIANYLSGENKDFQNFYSTCKKIRKIIENNKLLFISEDKIISTLNDTNINSLDRFLFMFSRNLNKEKISTFCQLTSRFEDHEIIDDLNEEQVIDRIKNLKMYIKINRILFSLKIDTEEKKKKLIEIKDSKLCRLLTDIGDFYKNGYTASVKGLCIQAFLVKYSVKDYLLFEDRKHIFSSLNIDIKKEIEQEEYQKSWIPLESYYDGAFL